MEVNKNDLNQFKEDLKDIKIEDQDKGYYNFEVTTTQVCNMRCKYCFEEGFKADPKTLNSDITLIYEKIDAFLSDPWAMEHFSGVNIDFWGGEPTNNFFMIESLVHRYLNNSRVRFHIYTNGYNISKLKPLLQEMVDKNKKHLFNVQFSYDGAAVHDERRILPNGGPTSERVLGNAKILYDMGIDINFKSTLIPTDFKHLSEIWDEFAILSEQFKPRINPESKPRYHPTIDYTNNYEKNYIDEFRAQVIKIAKKEIEYKKKKGHHLWTWLENAQKSSCSAGKTTSCLDINGEAYSCHGAMYLNSKEDQKIWSLKDNNEVFLSKIRHKFETFTKGMADATPPKKCEECVATMCMRCNVVKYDRSDKTDYFEKWTDYGNQPELCPYFKTFGKIHRAIRKINLEN